MNEKERLPVMEIDSDLVVTGGGLAGVSAAIVAARAGLKVTLVTDRPVLGGNASSEVRLWALGATSHMGNNNRWSREGGVIDEILVENLYRNREGNPIIFDALLLDKVLLEKNITLLLNTSVFDVEMKSDSEIKSVNAFCSQNETLYRLQAPLFADASGDGIVGYLSGAPYRIGLDEDVADKFTMPSDFGSCLGQTILFYSRHTGEKVNFVPPSYALKSVETLPHFERISSSADGCSYWWLEYLGNNDPVFDTESIKYELLKVVYGVWNHIKNSGQFPDAEDMTLEWAGFIPGKRESRRFEGDYLMKQEDIVAQRCFDDAVSFGGWAVDLHPSNGVYSSYPSCVQFHSKGVYQVPYRLMYSRKVKNLFLCGRIISASHVAAGSLRVMLTCAENAQAVGEAAALCREEGKYPCDIDVAKLQTRLLRNGQFIPFVPLRDEADLSNKADVFCPPMAKAAFRPNGKFLTLDHDVAVLFPVKKGNRVALSIPIRADGRTTLEVRLMKAEKRGNYTPEILLDKRTVQVTKKGEEVIDLQFSYQADDDEYCFLIFACNDKIGLGLSDTRLPGVLTLHHEVNEKVARGADQRGGEQFGFESFPFYLPRRIPFDVMLALTFSDDMSFYSESELKSGYARPFISSNCICMKRDGAYLKLKWNDSVSISRIVVTTDTDTDFAMETVQYRHPMSQMPMTLRNLTVRSGEGKIIGSISDNHQTRIAINVPLISTDEITLAFDEDNPDLIVIYDINVY